MKNYAYLFLAAVTFFSACEKEVIPEPVPVPKNLTVFSDNFKVPDMLYKVDPVSGDIYLQTWKQETLPGQKEGTSTYVPYLQRLDKGGKLKWNQWVPFTRKAGISYVNYTVFDTTTDGCVIDCFSAYGQNESSQAFITKINPDGTYAWGNEGKLFYDFGDKAVDSPCESFVAADNEGGAWIAAGNGKETLVIARVDKDGNFVVDPIVFSSRKGTARDKQLVRRPQMYVGADNSLFALLQYGNKSGEDDEDTMIEGYYDVVKIPADGNVDNIIQNHLMDDDQKFNGGMRALLTEDGESGAYAIFENGVVQIHAYLYHFDSNANVNVKGVDIYPSGSFFSALNIYTALDSKTKDLVILLQDLLPNGYNNDFSVVNLQIANQNGQLKYELDGKNILETNNKGALWGRMGYFVPAADGKFIYTFLWDVAKKSDILYQSRIDIDKGEMQDINEVVEIDEILSAGPSIDTRMQVTDGFLRHIWYLEDDDHIFGYDIKVF